MKKTLSIVLLSLFLTAGFAANTTLSTVIKTEVDGKDKDKKKKKKKCCKKDSEKSCCKKDAKKECKKGEEKEAEEATEE